MTSVIRGSFLPLMLRSVGALTAVTLTACTPAGKVEIVLDEACYFVPSSLVVRSERRFREDKLYTDGTVKQLVLRFPANDVQYEIAEYSTLIAGVSEPIDGTLSVIISELEDGNVRYIQSGKHFEDLWTGSGAYSPLRLGRQVTKDEEFSLFRVHRGDIKSQWIYVDIDPEAEGADLPSGLHVIAECKEDERMGRPNFICRRTALRGNIGVEYSITKDNFGSYSEIDEFVFGKLSSWRENRTECASLRSP